jgi:Fe-S-cluster-containing dehydrogenase component
MTFGDFEDPNSEVTRMLQSRNHHALMPEAGTKPCIFYLV